MEMLTLTPGDLGLPEQFAEFRSEQLTALERIAASDARVILLQAPTGSGKTLIMAALGRYLDEQILYTCHTKQLQEQVAADFPYAAVLKGRSNYPCLKGNMTCAECTKEYGNSKPARCKRCGYKSCDARGSDYSAQTCPCTYGCPYLRRKRQAKEAELAILNTPFFLNEANYAGDFSGWPWVILDEGDLTENSLMSFVEVKFTQGQIEKLNIQPPAKKTVAEAWYEWARDLAIPAIQSRLSELGDTLDVFELREKTQLEHLLNKCWFLLKQNLNQWVFIPAEDSWTFKPVFINRYADQYLWRHGERFLVMSATILSSHQFARDMGLSRKDVEFIELPSTFPPERRPIFFIPSADVTHRNKAEAWPRVVKALDKILEDHPSEKGLIHTVSYPLARFVFDNSAHKHRLLQHDTAHRATVLEKFKEEDLPLVLISPSMERGVDLPEDLCRFVVILKVPYPYLGDKQISARTYGAKDGDMWYAVQTIRTIVQATGRGMRSQDDSCVAYILDEQFRRLYNDWHNLFPAWWRQALKPSRVGGNLPK
ncbi:ATP-dependent DNA helicase DinG [subsurface metagenome]